MVELYSSQPESTEPWQLMEELESRDSFYIATEPDIRGAVPVKRD